MIDTELYKTFYIIASHKKISEAAREMHVSQPAVSKAIQKLENLTECVLFVRKPRGVELTTEGQILFDYAKKAFEQLYRGEEILKKIRQKEEGLVRVGISNTLCKYFFIPHLEAFHQKYPGIKIQVMNRTSPDTLKLLDNGLIDFGIVSIPREKGPYSYKKLIIVNDIFVYGDMKVRFGKKVRVSELNRYPLMLLEKKNSTRTFIDDYFLKNSVRFQPEIEISSMDFLIEFAKIGLGIACVIKEFVNEELKLKLLNKIPVYPVLPPRQIGIVQQKNIPVSNSADLFMNFLCQVSSS